MSAGATVVGALVRQYFPADQVGNAMAVAKCETRFRSIRGARNTNGTYDWGVFQLNDGGTLQAALRGIGVSFSSTAQAQQLGLDPELNVMAAARIVRLGGWGPWTCSYKLGVVKKLYRNSPGPNFGKFDDMGRPL